jgi:YesN/AraC family two-component response regulator
MQRIVIVDDSDKFRKGLRSVLYTIDATADIREASNGNEFLDIIRLRCPDLVFMDVKMPGMDGIEATRTARTLYPDVTIIGFSAYENQDYINMMIEAGANGYLLKSEDNYDALCYILSNPGRKLNQALKNHIKLC